MPPIDASVAAAAHTTLAAAYPAQAAGPTGLDAQYAGYIAALRADGRPGIDAGVAVGEASARDLFAFRAGDRDESITYTPPPLSPGTWTFAPAPSLQSAQTPWVATMRPFTLTSPSQFGRPRPHRCRAPDGGGVQRDEGLRLGESSVRTPQQTAVARFWNAQGVNQYNQAFQDVAAARGMDAVDTARVLAMGNVVGADAGIACWDAKYHYRFWRPSWRSATPGSTAIRRPCGIRHGRRCSPHPTTGVSRRARLPHGVGGGGPLDGADPDRSGFRSGAFPGGTMDNWTAMQRFERLGRPAGADRERPRVGRAALPRDRFAPACRSEPTWPGGRSVASSRPRPPVTADGRTDTPTQEDGHEAHGNHRRRHRGGRRKHRRRRSRGERSRRGTPAGTLTVDAQFPHAGERPAHANLADPKGSAETDPAKIADLFAGNGKLFQGGKQVGTLHFDNVVTQADPARRS